MARRKQSKNTITINGLAGPAAGKCQVMRLKVCRRLDGTLHTVGHAGRRGNKRKAARKGGLTKAGKLRKGCRFVKGGRIVCKKSKKRR